MTKYFLVPFLMFLGLVIFIAIIAPSKKISKQDYCLDQGGCWVEAESRCEFENQAKCK
jgi:hypothetical protein